MRLAFARRAAQVSQVNGICAAPERPPALLEESRDCRGSGLSAQSDRCGALLATAGGHER